MGAESVYGCGNAVRDRLQKKPAASAIEPPSTKRSGESRKSWSSGTGLRMRAWAASGWHPHT
eukprot:CAMPEP_0174752452 /NCGR_PEP_ID=MMETSP1094-20130205/102056_1 /TAXON_ID=156173 /ORGANISM="Chrysochromulina brevifilum, Strain UTEX LB 985" /LENGTH=61 /DNA_ID=CAMNT_0015958097 /DNA_START=103 /DNA_END=285 /DNA_ORIENTATION=-